MVDQTRRVKKFDDKHRIPQPAAVPSSLVAVALPSAGSSNPSPVLNVSGPQTTVIPRIPQPAAVPMSKVAAALPSPAHIPSPQKRPLPTRMASPGPGPKTMAAAAANWSFVTAARLGRIRTPREEDDMNVDVVLDPKGKGKQKETKRKRVDEEEQDECLLRPKKRTTVVEDTVPQTKKIKPRKENLVVAAKIDKHMEVERETVKGIVERLLSKKQRQVIKPISRSGSEFNESSSEEEVDSRPRPPIRSDVIQSRPRPPVSPLPPTYKSNRSLPIPTGEFYEPPCSTCQTARVECEKQATGEACVRCRTFKHKCEFSKIRKPKKSTPVVESDDESSTAAPRKPRQAAKAAKKAIKRSSCKSIDFVLQFLYINYNTLVSYKEETLSSAVEDILHHILEHLDNIFERKSLIS